MRLKFLCLLLVLSGSLKGLATAQTADGFLYADSEFSNEINIFGYVGNGGDITIPAKINGKPVWAITGRSFQDQTSITSVTIPDSVTVIGELAFANCENLVSIDLGNGVESIDAAAFFNTGLIAVDVGDQVWAIGNQTFSSCRQLKRVYLPGDLVYLGNRVFEDCPDVDYVVFKGNAPLEAGDSIFPETLGFTVYYYEGSSGFSSPVWQGRRSVMLPVPSELGGELRIASFTHQGDSVLLVVSGQEGWTYELQRSTDLGVTPWMTVYTLDPLERDGPVELADLSASAAQAYYRVVGSAP